MIERHKVRTSQIGNMHIIPYACTVRCWIVAAINAHIGASSECRLKCHFDKMGRTRCRLTMASGRIGSRDVKVAQDHIPQIICRACIASIYSDISFDLP